MEEVTRMKQLIVLLSLLWVMLCGCVSFQDPVMNSLPSEGKGTMYTHGEFQDYTDYGKYEYSGITAKFLDRNEYFQIVNSEDIPELMGYLDNFEGWVAHAADCDECELAEMYDFSSTMIREGDYFCLQSDADSTQTDYAVWKYADYDIYYFSIETQTLYYFHNNI